MDRPSLHLDEKIKITLRNRTEDHSIVISSSILLENLTQRHILLEEKLSEKPDLKDKVELEKLKNSTLFNHVLFYNHNTRDTKDPEQMVEFFLTVQENYEIINKVLPLLTPTLVILGKQDSSNHINQCRQCQVRCEVDLYEYNRLSSIVKNEDFKTEYDSIIKDISEKYNELREKIKIIQL